MYYIQKTKVYYTLNTFKDGGKGDKRGFLEILYSSESLKNHEQIILCQLHNKQWLHTNITIRTIINI